MCENWIGKRLSNYKDIIDNVLKHGIFYSLVPNLKADSRKKKQVPDIGRLGKPDNIWGVLEIMNDVFVI